MRAERNNPFLGSKIGKLHEASCVTFERVVVQNILHGLSPSLSGAIASVSRWRFVRAAFPHIVQCCASLLSEWVEKDDPQFSGSLTKILYILHWLLLDSANECCDSDGENDGGSVRKYTFSVSSIQLFVYLMGPLIHDVSEQQIASNIRLESGLRIWQALWQYRSPDVLCFCAPVKQRRTKLPYVSLIKKPTSNAAAQCVYLGDEGEMPAKRSRFASKANVEVTNLIPPPKPPRTDLSVLSSIRKEKETNQQKLNENTEAFRATVSGVNNCSSDDDNQLASPTDNETDSESNNLSQQGKMLHVVRSISEYKVQDLPINLPQHIRRSITTNSFDISPSIYKGIQEIDDALKFVENNSLSSDTICDTFDKAPLAQLNEITSNTDLENLVHANEYEVVCELCNTVIFQKGVVAGTCKCEQKASENDTTQDKVATTPVEKSPSILGTETAHSSETERDIRSKEKDRSEEISMISETTQQYTNDPTKATYMDVAVIRCLLIKHWSEEGVYWALRYIFNRLTDIESYLNTEGFLRSRSNSVPVLGKCKIFRADTDSKQNMPEMQYRTPTWDDLQLSSSTLKPGLSQNNSFASKPPSMDKKENIYKQNDSSTVASVSSLRINECRRRNSITSSASKFQERRLKMQRNRSDPSLTNSSEYLLNRESTRSGSMGGARTPTENFNSTKEYYPEVTTALGSSNFIERDGGFSCMVVMQALNLLMERYLGIRICELALNICDIILNMPGIEQEKFFSENIKVILRSYLWLGCPHGCNEGMRAPQADFLRIKARTLFALMHRINPEIFSQTIVDQVQEYNIQNLLDVMHAITGFCKVDLASKNLCPPSPRKSSSLNDPKAPNYWNHFNESLKGIEGNVVDVLFKPSITRLSNAFDEIMQPENMIKEERYSLYHDVRAYVTFVQEHHGNPFRRVALSALLDGRAQGVRQHSTSIDMLVTLKLYSLSK
uniref:UNC80 domain-containing protein n=1 Tax=Syphacia muris TaxID=451379 RepID=A0A0N5AB72_9BILA